MSLYVNFMHTQDIKWNTVLFELTGNNLFTNYKSYQILTNFMSIRHLAKVMDYAAFFNKHARARKPSALRELCEYIHCIYELKFTMSLT